MAKQIISRDKLLEHGLHYGHQTKSWDPAMKPFIAMARKGIHVINLDRTSQSLENAYNVAKKITERRGTFLFVGTTKQSGLAVKENAERVGAFYIDYRWLGGLLTNFRTIQNSVNKLRSLERLEKTNFEGYTKKEGINMKKQLDKLQKALGGIKHMRRTPQAIFVTSIRNEDIAIKEAKKMGIPVFGIADTNVNPSDVNFPIYGNDDANKSVSLVATVIADAIAAAKNEKQLAAYVEDEKMTVMGINPELENKPRNPRFSRNERSDRNERPARRNEAPKAEKPATVKAEEVKEEVKPAAPAVEVTAPAPVVEEAKAPVNEEEEREKTRELILAKITPEAGLSNVKLTELFGVGPKTAEWLSAKGFDTVEKLAEADSANIEEADLENLNLVGFKSVEEKKQRLSVFITEAQYIVSKAK